jgi:hypothetical protein
MFTNLEEAPEGAFERICSRCGLGSNAPPSRNASVVHGRAGSEKSRSHSRQSSGANAVQGEDKVGSEKSTAHSRQSSGENAVQEQNVPAPSNSMPSQSRQKERRKSGTPSSHPSIVVHLPKEEQSSRASPVPPTEAEAAMPLSAKAKEKQSVSNPEGSKLHLDTSVGTASSKGAEKSKAPASIGDWAAGLKDSPAPKEDDGSELVPENQELVDLLGPGVAYRRTADTLKEREGKTAAEVAERIYARIAKRYSEYRMVLDFERRTQFYRRLRGIWSEVVGYTAEEKFLREVYEAHAKANPEWCHPQELKYEKKKDSKKSLKK